MEELQMRAIERESRFIAFGVGLFLSCDKGFLSG